jgi:hypothetical protein
MIRQVSVHRAGLARLAAAALAPLAMLALAAPAMAGKPTGEFANFTECPLGNPAVITCIYGKTTSGEFTIGSTTVPLTKATTLQGGLNGELEFINAANGETLSKTPQTVPGGLLKIMAPSFLPGFLQELFNEFIDKGITGVTATTELVSKPTLNLFAVLTGEGPALTLPVRVHLENTFLGSGCYVGSSAHPVTVALTTGTTSPPAPNKPISGSPGEPEVKDEGELLILHKNSLVNNSFAAPEAEGCGGFFSFLIDPAVDAEIGLPSAAGHNTAILDGTQEVAGAEKVKASE